MSKLADRFFAWLSEKSEAEINRLFYYFWGLCSAFSALCLLITPLDLSADEAHYWDWSRRLDWSYYSKGPGIALLIRLGTMVFGDTAFGVRSGALLCAALLWLFGYLFLRELHGARVALLSWLLFRFTVAFIYPTYVMTTDPPLLLLWIMAILCAWRALERKQSKLWIPAWSLIGIAFLFKYTAVMLGVGFVGFLLFERDERRLFFDKNFIVGLLSAFLFAAPVFYWNAEHGWVNFSHNAGHVVKASGVKFSGQYFLELLGGQLGLIGIPLMVIVLWGLGAQLRNLRRLTKYQRFLIWTVLPLLFLCLGVSLTKRVYANWPLPLYIGVLLFSAIWIKEKIGDSKFQNWVMAALIYNAVGFFVVHLCFMDLTLGLPPKLLPTKKLSGWEAIGSTTEGILSRPAEKESPLFVLTSRYDDASAIAFYAASHPHVYCANNGERRMNQYDVWGGWSELKGRSALIVLREKEVPPVIAREFLTVEPLGDWLAVFFGGEVLREYNFFIGREFSGIAKPSPDVY